MGVYYMVDKMTKTLRGSKTKEYFNRIKKLSKIPESELNRREKIRLSSIEMWKDPKKKLEIGKKISENWSNKSIEEKQQRADRISKAKTGKKISDETRESIVLSHKVMSKEKKIVRSRRMREAKLKHLKEVGNVHYGKNEKRILDNIEKEQNIKILRQYHIIGYALDGYCQETNIAYEVDESYHFKRGKLSDYDLKRQNAVEEILGCKFIRIKDC